MTERMRSGEECRDMQIEIRKLRSGFWSVWVNGDWVEASLPNEEAAREYVRTVYGKEV